MAVSTVKIRQFIASVVALGLGVAVIAIATEVMGFSIPVLNAIPHAIGIEAGGQ